MVEPKKFEIVREEDDLVATRDTPSDSAGVGLATDLLVLSLKALSKRSLIAISNLFCLLTVGSVFVLFYNIPNPSVLQIINLTIYSLFVLAANAIVRRM